MKVIGFAAVILGYTLMYYGIGMWIGEAGRQANQTAKDQDTANWGVTRQEYAVPLPVLLGVVSPKGETNNDPHGFTIMPPAQPPFRFTPNPLVTQPSSFSQSNPPGNSQGNSQGNPSQGGVVLA